MSDVLGAFVLVYVLISIVTTFVLWVVWLHKPDDGKKQIWPIAGFLWPILAVIGVVKAWENRHDL